MFCLTYQKSLKDVLHKQISDFFNTILSKYQDANSFCNTRNKRMFHSRHIRTFHFGSEMLLHLAPRIWGLVPEEIRKLESVASFKNAIKIVLAAYVEHIYFRLAL